MSMVLEHYSIIWTVMLEDYSIIWTVMLEHYSIIWTVTDVCDVKGVDIIS